MNNPNTLNDGLKSSSDRGYLLVRKIWMNYSSDKSMKSRRTTCQHFTTVRLWEDVEAIDVFVNLRLLTPSYLFAKSLCIECFVEQWKVTEFGLIERNKWKDNVGCFHTYIILYSLLNVTINKNTFFIFSKSVLFFTGFMLFSFLLSLRLGWISMFVSP